MMKRRQRHHVDIDYRCYDLQMGYHVDRSSPVTLKSHIVYPCFRARHRESDGIIMLHKNKGTADTTSSPNQVHDVIDVVPMIQEEHQQQQQQQLQLQHLHHLQQQQDVFIPILSRNEVLEKNARNSRQTHQNREHNQQFQPAAVQPAPTRIPVRKDSGLSSLPCGSILPNPAYDPAKDPANSLHQFVPPSEIEIVVWAVVPSPSHDSATEKIGWSSPRTVGGLNCNDMENEIGHVPKMWKLGQEVPTSPTPAAYQPPGSPTSARQEIEWVVSSYAELC